MFNCTKCGLCCQHVDLTGLNLEHVNGVCVQYDPEKKECKIYDRRPIVCQIDEGWEFFFKGQMTREEFYELNLKACKQLQELHRELTNKLVE